MGAAVNHQGEDELGKVEAHLDKKHVIFYDPEVERDYKINVAKDSREAVRHTFFWGALVFLSFFVKAAANRDGSTFTTIAFGAACSVTSAGIWFTKHPRWVAGNEKFVNAETVISSILAFNVTALSFGLYGVMYTRTLSLERDRKVFEGFHVTFGMWPTLITLVLLHVNVVHYRSCRALLYYIVAIHGARALFIHPVADMVPWVILNYIFWLPLVIVMARNKQIGDRRRYIYQRQLRTRNMELNSKLSAANKALLYEAPTMGEQAVVQRIMSSVDLKYLEISFDQLELEKHVGFGGFAEVIKAQYCGTSVAVKRLLRQHINEQTVRMLVDEIDMLRNLRHANIVQLVGASWDSVANICMVLEYVERGSLQDLLKDGSVSLSWSDPLLKMLIDVTEGLLYLHRRPTPILHRDMKPANVLVTPTFGCKLVDFGASCMRANDRTMTQIGTTNYMAPEVIKGSRYDEKVDIYALGIMIVEMHTRLDPFEFFMGGSVIGAVITGMRPEIPRGVPKDLAELSQACWADEPTDRPTCGEVLTQLKLASVSSCNSNVVVTTGDRRSSVANVAAADSHGGADTVVIAVDSRE